MSTQCLPAIALVLSVASVACSKIPKDRSAVDAVDIHSTGDLGEGEVSDKISTAATSKFLGLFRGVTFDYEIYDETVLQRDLARIERYYQGHGYLDVHARSARVIRKSVSHVRVEIEVEAGPPTLNRRVAVDGIDSIPPAVAEAARLAATRARSKASDEGLAPGVAQPSSRMPRDSREANASSSLLRSASTSTAKRELACPAASSSAQAISPMSATRDPWIAFRRSRTASSAECSRAAPISTFNSSNAPTAST
jgi:hypothetical protein